LIHVSGWSGIAAEIIRDLPAYLQLQDTSMETRWMGKGYCSNGTIYKGKAKWNNA